MTTKKHIASSIQKQFWMANYRDPKSPVFNVPSVFSTHGRLDVSGGYLLGTDFKQ